MVIEPMRVLLSLGSNVGDRRANLRNAVDAIDAIHGTEVSKISSVYETEPVGPGGQPDYLNMAVEVETASEPLELLNGLKEVERRLGRRVSERWGPRVIDIDIVLWGRRTRESEKLTLPHPEFRRRAFVLEPLAEIAPDAIDPVTGKSVRELASQPGLAGPVIRTEKLGH